MTPPTPTAVTRDEWVLEYDTYAPDDELLREALCTLGNGRFATRGAAPELPMVEERHYPGTYFAGLFNRLSEEKAGREIVNESLVNLPNWLLTTFRIDDGPWFSIDEVDVIEFRQTLEIDRGMLVRRIRFVDGDGRETSVTQRRLRRSRPTCGPRTGRERSRSGRRSTVAWRTGTWPDIGICVAIISTSSTRVSSPACRS
jgi:trehalose/maltose hydrolase-like predicted phosphorylase